MPTLGEQPAQLRPYLFHRIDLNFQGDSDAKGDCPFCGKAQHFFVSQKTGQYNCKVCGKRGNNYTFLRELYSICRVKDTDLELVAEERRVTADTLKRWGLVQSAIDREWILPSYGPPKTVDNKRVCEVNNLYRWSPIKGKRRLLTTATMDHGLFGLHLWDDSKPDVYINEGPWDGMGLEENLRKYRREGQRLVRTADESKSLYSLANVVAVPGCETFRDNWVAQFKGKNVILLYDNDWPQRFKEGHAQAGQFILKKDGTKTIAGYDGMKTAARKLAPVAKTIRILNWGPEGYDESLPNGHDVRDLLHA